MCYDAGHVVSEAFGVFEMGEGPIHLEGLRCAGDEESLFDCRHNGVGVHSCGPYDDADVVCYIGKLYNVLANVNIIVLIII